MRMIIVWFLVCLILVFVAKTNNFLPQAGNQVLGTKTQFAP